LDRYEVKGQWYTVAELSEMSGILPHTLRDRLRRGYSVEEALKPLPTNDSVKEFCDASHWEDWLGMSISYLYNIYWKWVVSNGGTPTSKQGFSRHLMQMYPMLKTVPTRQDDGYARIIRMRG
jgi:hypothetical protein